MRLRRTAALVFLLAAGLLLSACSLLDEEPLATDDTSASATPSATSDDTPTATTTKKSAKPEKSKKPEKSPERDASSSPKSDSTGPSVDLGKPPESYSEAAAHVNSAERSGEAQQLERFESPDANFHCVLDHEFIRPSCEMKDRSIRDEKLCATGMSPYMGRIELTGKGWKPFCNSDTIREPGATKLQVGSVAAWPDRGITCVLEKIGMTCISNDRQGFFLGTGQYAVF